MDLIVNADSQHRNLNKVSNWELAPQKTCANAWYLAYNRDYY